MRAWDLSIIVARLESAMESLKKAKIEVASQWDDERSRAFDDAYLLPLEPKVRRATEAIHHLAEMLQKAERECS